MLAPGQPLLFVLGTSHRTATMELREQLHMPEEELQAFLPLVKERFDLLEIAALSTCNRFELYGVVRETPGFSATLYEAFLDLHRRRGVSEFPVEEVRQAAYLHLSEFAVAHIFRVAASLDSLVLGETQITGQFKDALALAGRIKTSGPVVTRLGQEALSAAKKVRTQTAIGKKNVSIGHAAIELAKKVFGDLAAHRFLLVGAGEMSQVAAKYILSYQPKALYVANRTVDNARDLVRTVGAGEAFGLTEIPSLLVKADVVLSATAATGLVIDAATVKRAMAARRGRPLVLLDIAMPRDIGTACDDLDDVYLFDIDDLTQVVDANYEERRRAAEEAEQLVSRGVEAFLAWLRTLSLKPAFASFRAYLDGLISREAGRTFGREIFKDLTPRQREALEALFEAVAGKIAGDAARQVLNPPEGYYQEQLADALGALFPVPLTLLNTNDKTNDKKKEMP